MLPIPTQDVWTLATEEDWRKALAILGRSPCRPTSSAEFDQQLYFIALKGTTKFGLATAVEKILQNALGHKWFPEPQELRGQCDKAMKPHEEYRARMAHRRKLAEERAAHTPVPARTQAEIVRAKRLLDDFHARYEKAADAFTPTLDPELVANVPDNPKACERMGIQE